MATMDPFLNDSVPLAIGVCVGLVLVWSDTEWLGVSIESDNDNA